jgi:hypothetical protein
MSSKRLFALHGRVQMKLQLQQWSPLTEVSNIVYSLLSLELVLVWIFASIPKRPSLHSKSLH